MAVSVEQVVHTREDVAAFIGADRGYRALQFFTSGGLALQPLSTVTEQQIDDLYLAEQEWRLVVRDDGSPFGWIDAGGVEVHRHGGSLYDSVAAGGSLFSPDGTLRAALDSALSSPSGTGVAVDESGAVVGGVLVEDVIDALEDQRRATAEHPAD